MKNYNKVFTTFKKHYQLVPLEIFKTDPYKVLVSTLLSSRTNDDTTLTASKRLFKIAPNINSLSNLSVQQIDKLIYPVGFHKTKSNQLTKLAQIIIESHQGKIPNNKADLLTLPGVGIKTANLVLNRAFNIPAIAVDTHVHRISNLLGWVKTDTPEKTELELVKILPKKYWADTNRFFVSIGRQFRSKKQLELFLKNNKLI